MNDSVSIDWTGGAGTSEQEAHKHKLAVAMQTRVLTEAEMQEAIGYGTWLVTSAGESYFEEDKQKQFNEAICQQYRLRAITNPPEINHPVTEYSWTQNGDLIVTKDGNILCEIRAEVFSSRGKSND